MGLRAWVRRKLLHRSRRRQVGSKLVKRLDLAQSVYTDIEVLARLALDKSVQVRQLVASNPATTPEIVERLIQDENQIVRYNIAERLDLSEENINNLANDPSENVLNAIALREELTPEQERTLYQGGTGVRQKLALRKGLDFSVSKLLFNDPDLRVRILLAGMTQHLDILEMLEKEDNFEIRQVIAKRKGVYDHKDPRWNRRKSK